MNLNIYPNDIDFFIEENEKLPADPPPSLISEYIEGRRIMPSSTRFPGIWKNWRTHYAVEVMDSMSPWSGIKYTDVMAAAQTIKSTTVENVLAYYMDAMPSPIVYVSGTDDLLQKWASKRLEPLIDSIGMRGKIRAPNESKKSRSTGDKAKQKLYTGGFLEMASAQSPSSLRADSSKILALEEIDSAPPELNTGEGRFDQVAEARTKVFDSTKRILAVSTPTSFENSLIYKRYLLGDQRYYFMPCPHCKKDQLFERGDLRGNHGLRCETKAGEIEYVYYLCAHCHEAIFEYHKNWMIPRGHWEPSAKGEKFRRSYQINSLYSAVGMYSWLSYWTEFKQAEITPGGMASFTNLQDGLPYKESGARRDYNKVIELRGNYNEGSVPDGVLYIVGSGDVQRGDDNNPKYPARIEMEFLGIGAGYRSFSITYKIFYGKVDNANEGAWLELTKWVEGGGLNFKKKSGYVMRPSLMFFDAGYLPDVVFSFCEGWDNTYAIRGRQQIALKKGEKRDLDIAGPQNIRRYKRMKSGTAKDIYEISTNWYKTIIYNALGIERQASEEQKPGYCDFPIGYTERYFKQLTAEEKLTDGTFYKPNHRRNETLDCRVYNLCAADVWMDKKVMDFKTVAKNSGATDEQTMGMSHRWVVDMMVEENKKTLIVQ